MWIFKALFKSLFLGDSLAEANGKIDAELAREEAGETLEPLGEK